MAEEIRRVEINWSKVICILGIALGVFLPAAWLLIFVGAAGAEIPTHGFKNGIIRAFGMMLGWFSLLNFVYTAFLLGISVPRYRRLKKQPLLWFAGEKEKSQTATRDYERKAYLSCGEAIKQKPYLAGKPLRDVYAWLKRNGIEIDGRDYDLPDQPTWLRYRSAGERAVNSNQKSG